MSFTVNIKYKIYEEHIMKNALIWTCRSFIGLTAVILLLAAFMWSFAPDANMLQNGISAEGILGRNMIKSDIGAGLFVASIFSFLYLFKGKQWFLPSVITVSAYLTIRTVSLIVDGYAQMAMFGVGLEATVLAALLVLNKLQQQEANQ